MGRLSRAPGGQQVNAEEMLAELVRLVESSGLAPKRSAPPVETESEPERTDAEPMRPLEMASPRPLVDPPPSKPSETRPVDVEPPRALDTAKSYPNDPNGSDLATGQRSGAWTFKVSALVLACAALMGTIFWFKRVEPGGPTAPAFIATAQAPATVPPRSPSTVATSSDAGATPLKGVTQPAVVSPEQRPIDLNAGVSLDNPPPSADLGPIAPAATQPTADASAGKPLAEPVNAPTAAAPIAAAPPTGSAALDSKPVPVPTVPISPDQSQIAGPTPSATNPGAAGHASDAPLPPVRPAPKAAIDAAGVAERSTAKLELPTKLSSKATAHVVVAKADAAGHWAPMETASEPLRLGAPVNPEKGAKTLNAAQSPAEAPAAPSPQPAPAKQSNPNPVVHAFNSVVGAVTSLIPFVPH
jgi:hypothetical protein